MVTTIARLQTIVRKTSTRTRRLGNLVWPNGINGHDRIDVADTFTHGEDRTVKLQRAIHPTVSAMCLSVMGLVALTARAEQNEAALVKTLQVKRTDDFELTGDIDAGPWRKIPWELLSKRSSDGHP